MRTYFLLTLCLSQLIKPTLCLNKPTSSIGPLLYPISSLAPDQPTQPQNDLPAAYISHAPFFDQSSFSAVYASRLLHFVRAIPIRTISILTSLRLPLPIA